MVNAPSVKNELIDKFWLPTTLKWGNVLRPRLKKNKKLKLLTLTSDVSFGEVAKFEEGGLTKKEHVVAWTYSHIKKLRLETEISPARVFGPARYETCTSRSSFPIKGHFSFDMINLDFLSQDPSFEIGRVEKEMKSLEETIRLQKEMGGDIFILMYTTVLNSNDLDYTSVVQTSNNMPVLGWAGLPSEVFPGKIGEQAEKMRCIETVLSRICSKYEYGGEIDRTAIPLGGDMKYTVYSIALLISRG